jgi:hypothetical protein
MKALTIYEPWATLIMIGAKPFEFRRWDYRTRERALEGQRIVIHASARPMKPAEVLDIKQRLDDGGDSTSLIIEKARPLIEKLLALPAKQIKTALPLGHALGTAILGTPRDVNRLFQTPDSDRIDHHMWGWPLTEIQDFKPPVEVRGLQGFWNYPFKEAA